MLGRLRVDSLERTLHSTGFRASSWLRSVIPRGECTVSKDLGLVVEFTAWTLGFKVCKVYGLISLVLFAWTCRAVGSRMSMLLFAIWVGRRSSWYRQRVLATITQQHHDEEEQDAQRLQQQVQLAQFKYEENPGKGNTCECNDHPVSNTTVSLNLISCHSSSIPI